MVKLKNKKDKVKLKNKSMLEKMVLEEVKTVELEKMVLEIDRQ